jgi:hypothetical protein
MLGAACLILSGPASSAACEARAASMPATSGADRATAVDAADGRASFAPDAAAVFPLSVGPGERYLVDAAGRPFLIQGDTAWSLIAQLTREDVELYLDDRRARGFNTILVNLIESRFATNAPANAYGQSPFLKPGQYDTPNEAYFEHADWVLRRAADKGFLVLLTPSYVGFDGGSQGWYAAMVANGPERLREYGEYLGRRYRDFDNILWVHGGDYDPPRKDVVRAIAEGIAAFDLRALHTAHCAPETAVFEYWQEEHWLDVNNVYTYGPVCAAAVEQYARPEQTPYFLIESAYENEQESNERRLRTQVYHAALSGAAGQTFGNNPIWHFDGPGIHPAPVTWRVALDSRGAQSMTHFRNLLASMPWWLLQPDVDHTLLTEGLGPEDQRAVAARTADGSLAIVYLPDRREITVDLAQFAGPDVAARWYDPAAGRFFTVAGAPFPATGRRGFSPVPQNSSGFDDWALVLESPA